MLVALVPSLTFIGHWTLRLPIPGTGFYVGLPATPAAADSTAAAGDHAGHCHSDSESCSNTPLAGASAVAVLSQAVTLLGASAALVALAALTWRPDRVLTLAPELRPPRIAAAALA